MIGNDVVDLNAAADESNWQRRGYLEKIFSAKEQESIALSQNPHQMIWLLWSMKEAAYKARQRLFELPPLLNWLSHHCEIVSQTPEVVQGKVKVKGHTFFTFSELHPEVIHSTAIAQKQLMPEKGLFKAPSNVVKKDLLTRVGRYFSLPESELCFIKNPSGVPFIAHEDEIKFCSFSFSDHGRYAAYSLSLRNS